MTVLANLTVVIVGVLWGLYWLPLRALDGVATAGPWATLAATATGLLVLAPAAWRGRRDLKQAGWPALASLVLGGASFVLYSNGLLYGHVAVVILLFYLTPVWSTLIGRMWLGQPMTWWRYAAVGVGLLGVSLVLRGSHGGLPLPHNAGDWLGLASGIGWAVASVGINRYSRTAPAQTNFVFCSGAALAAGVFVLAAGTPAPDLGAIALAPAIAWTLVIGGLWWAASLTLFLHAAQRLDPARVGILLMSEVIAGALSAALLTDEPFGALMTVGAVVVVVAALLETVPAQGPAASVTVATGSRRQPYSR